MKDSLDQIGHAIATNPKAGAVASAGITATGLDGWLFNVLPDVLSIIASIVGIVLALFILRYHWINTKKVKLEVEQLELKNEKLREEDNDCS